MSKTIIFIAGKSKTGKTSIVHALTGCSKDGFWKVNDLVGNRIWALIILSSIGERKMPKQIIDLVDELEKQVKIKARNKAFSGEYSLVICPIRPKLAKKYIILAKAQNHIVKVAGIETDYNGNQINLTLLKNWCNANNVPYIGINANNDYNLETNKLRQNYYP